MTGELILLAVLVGGANWAFRVLPILMMRPGGRPGGALARFLAASGPAALATLVVAALLPAAAEVQRAPALAFPLVAGVAATVLAFLPRRSVVAATLAGAAAYAAVHALAVPG